MESLPVQILPTKEKGAEMRVVSLPLLTEATPEVHHGLDDESFLKRIASLIPDTVDNCVHKMIQDRAASQPDAPAVHAWDGQLTYAQLISYASSFALQLAEHKVGPEVYVPIYSEKSVWVAVAVLAVLKAGGAFVLLDPSHPTSRLTEICRTLGANSIVASRRTAGKAVELVSDVLVVGDDLESTAPAVFQDAGQPHNAAYAVFTSGTSGTPKGVTIEHRAYCSSATYQAEVHGLNADTRTFQFSSFAFDACIADILTTMIVGGCICIPSDEERTSDVSGAIQRLRPNFMVITPSVGRILNPDEVPSLRTFIMGGEAVHLDDIRKWAPRLNLFIDYGVSECAVISTARLCTVAGDDHIDHTNVGVGVGVTCWVVDPDNHDQLMPVGEVGELLLDGPTVGRGYINNAQRNAKTFIDPPSWYKQYRSDRTSAGIKFYKTGDLVYYSPNRDGSLCYVGRKDLQVKFHGQRLEVDDVEHHLRSCLPSVRGLVVDVVKLEGTEVMTAFIQDANESGESHAAPVAEAFMAPSDEFRERARLVQQTLSNTLPKWMIPTLFLPLLSTPLTPSGKVDRRKLRAWAANLGRSQLRSYTTSLPSQTIKRQPENPKEKALQHLWANVLGIMAEEIGLDDKFFDLGADSVSAMKLAGAARREGLDLPVRLVYETLSLEDMAACLQEDSRDESKAVPPFSLLPQSHDPTAVIASAMEQCHLDDPSEIEDVYPSTPLQEGLMSLSIKKPGAYTISIEYELPDDLDAPRFRDAVDVVAKANPILRTRIIQVNGALYSVVVQGNLSWASSSAELANADDFALGSTLTRPCLCEPSNPGDHYKFALTFHHALCDGWALPLLLKQVQAAYEGQQLASRPFAPFVEYTMQAKDSSEEFWKNKLTDLETAVFPALPSPAYIPTPTVKRTVGIPVNVRGGSQYSAPTRLKLAWSILISLYTDSSDTIFGVTVAGRGAPVLGIEEMTGPTIATVPCRLNVPSDATVAGALQLVQDESVDTMPFEQIGLQYISRLGPEPAAACGFQSLMVIQPEKEDAPTLFRAMRDLSSLDAFSTYAINLICYQTRDHLSIEATFDPNVIQETQFDRMMNQLGHIFQQLSLSNDGLRISDLDVTCAEDWAELRHQQVDIRPDAPAICAWDGDFTYSELDAHSSSLAAYLMEQGLGPEIFVPLLFEKSRWTTVAMLGVVKAGGAFILVDPSHPVQRLQAIGQEARAPFVITSERYADKACSLTPRTIVLGRDWNSAYKPDADIVVPNPALQPHHPIYAVFTSGSTGTPKGAVHSHISWTTSALANIATMFLGPESRIFQFAAYAFDISVSDNLLTLVAGGCICVPSNEDLQGGRLADSINDLRSNWAFTTPSVARIIDPVKVPTLKTLLVAGEPIPPEVVLQWAPHVHLLNAYGPAECAIVTTIQPQLRDPKDPNNIGFPSSAACWVVDPKNENRLAPIGTVGELFVESPIVSLGYLNNPERTAASFIFHDNSPSWLTNFRPGGSCRLYRTGDLVQRKPDGSLRYIGRKDTQVKLRGQRIELGEVEHYAKKCFADTVDVVADVIVPHEEGRAPFLAAFVSSKSEDLKVGMDGEVDVISGPTDRFRELSQKARAYLSASLPTYMVPEVFLPLRRLPFTRSRKVDRRMLRETCAGLSIDQIRSYTSEAGVTKRGPSTKAERKLQQIWAKVLKMQADSIGMDDNFFRIGGDSIAAMQVVAECAAAGFETSVPALFRLKTIGQLSLETEERHYVSASAVEPLYEKFSLSPIQKLFFETCSGTHNHFNQSRAFRLPKSVPLARLKDAVRWIVTNHSMLRARFVQSLDNGWEQIITDDIAHSYLDLQDRVPTTDEANQLFYKDQERLNIEHGPLVVSHIFDIDTDDSFFYLALTVHHLAIDNASWHIILTDLALLIHGEQEPLTPPMPYQAWCQLQASYAAKALHPSKVLPKFTPPDMSSYWAIEGRGNCWGDADDNGFELPADISRILLGPANDAFGTTTVEVLHAALLSAFVATFRDRSPPVIFSESHGREPWDPAIDVSRTVGWFSTVWPADVAVRPNDSFLDIVRKVKDGRRHVKNNGWEYLMSRYLHPEGAAVAHRDAPLEIVLDYDTGFSEDSSSVLQRFPLGDGERFQVSPQTGRFALIDIRAEVRSSKLCFGFTYNRHMQCPVSSIDQWIRNTRQYLESAASILTQQVPTFTISDFPLLAYSYDELDRFNDGIVARIKSRSWDVEDAYPCSPAQEGMLLSQAKVAGLYANRWFWPVKNQDGSAVDLTRLMNAWEKVLQKHPVLRSVFYEEPNGTGRHSQVVLRTPPMDICATLQTNDDPLSQLYHQVFEPAALSPPHRLTIFSSSSGEVACLFEVDHTVVDGLSLEVFLRDLRLAYDDRLEMSTVNAYRQYISWLANVPVDEAVKFWNKYLASVEPCLLPASSPSGALDPDLTSGETVQHKTLPHTLAFKQELADFCAHHGLTMASVFQLAWALVLRVYLNSSSACFGYMSAGRDIPIPGMHDAVGPFINLLICSIQLGSDRQILELLHTSQAEFVQSLEYQHLPLTEKIRAAKTSADDLFNTAMSVQKEMEQTTDGCSLEIGRVVPHGATEYDLLVNIAIHDVEINVLWAYNNTFLSDEHVENVADAFEQAVRTIMQDPYQTVGKASLYGKLHGDRLSGYQQQEYEPVDEFVDKLIERRCLSQPTALAVDAWDGAFTYEDLDVLSWYVAAELQRRAVGPNQLVPLYFERSRWTAVAMLGVVKAGAAVLLLDPSQPMERLRDFCRQAGATVVLASHSKKEGALDLATDVVVVDDDITGWELSMDPGKEQGRRLDDAVYAVFTSGSTGKPKAVILDHRNLASGITYHGKATLMDTETRTLQFSSYAFDAAIMEHLTTLGMGGCICIPSDMQRQDIAQAVAVLEANWAVLTPSVARVLNPADFPTLRTLMFGGEAVTRKEFDAWRCHVNLVLAYGPAECTIMSAGQYVSPDITDSRTLGRCCGSTGWVVSPDDPNQLLPLGAVGELLLEGPIVGRGYLNNLEKTAEAFIAPPTWLVKFRGTSPGRVYRTGDLVRYTDGGALQFISRKDHQVKLRGQRLELGEVETHLRSSFRGAGDAVVEVVKPAGDGARPMLVAFVCWRGPADSEGAQDDFPPPENDFLMQPNREFSAEAQNAEMEMAKSLPTYMIPVAYLPLSHMPYTTTGKLDRKKLRCAAGLLTPEQLDEYNSSAVSNEMPRTEFEAMLQGIWAKVLDKDPSSVGIHNNFFRLGGDSISAMQVSSQCRAAGVTVAVADIFRCKTISQLAILLQGPPTSEHASESTGEPFDLLPIQSLYFEVSPLGNLHFNESLLLRLTRPISGDALGRAIHDVVRSHSMLRARFSQNRQGRWVQSIVDDVAGSYSFTEHTISTTEAMDGIISSSQLTVDVQQGPILVADKMTVGHEQYLFIAAPRLVIDPMSWRIVVEDLEEYVNRGSISRAPSLPFPTWCSLQAQYATEHLDPEKARLDGGMPTAPTDYWGLDGKSNLVGDTLQASFSLDKETTTCLLESANGAFQTKPVELFQAALIDAFAQTFPDRSPATLWNRGHGREPWATNINISGTVGCFSTMWPMHVPTKGNNILDVIRRTKDQYRAAPSNGWAHYASLLHPKSQHLPALTHLTEITFDYSDRHGQVERPDSLFQRSAMPQTKVSASSDQLGRLSIFDVLAEVRGGRLCFDFHFNKFAAIYRPVRDWVKRSKETLVLIAEQVSIRPREFTLSDFPLMNFGYESLRKFLDRAAEENGVETHNIEDVYPCSPLQLGILLSQAKAPDQYQTSLTWKIQAKDSGPVDLGRAVTAWKTIVARHPIYRTMFVRSTNARNFMDQVVLKNVSAHVSILPQDDEAGLLKALQEQPRVAFDSRKSLAYQMTMGRTSAGHVLCGLVMSHALLDGASQQNMLREMAQAYDDASLASSPGPAYGDFIAYLQSQSTAAKDYWTQYLDGVAPCHLPGNTMEGVRKPSSVDRYLTMAVDIGESSIIRRFCETYDLALSNLFQVAWALVLKSYLDSDSICFGFLSGGREVPVPNAPEIMGPLINVLICRMGLEGSKRVESMLRENQSQYIQSMNHQHYPLAEVIRATQEQEGGSLFNTVISLQNVKHAAPDDGSSVTVELVGGEGLSEFDVSVLVTVGPERIDIGLGYWESFMTRDMASGIVDSLRHTLTQIMAGPSTPLAGLSHVGPDSMRTLHAWSGTLPSPENSLIHDVIRQRCLAQPDAPAVESWDGSFTYQEVDRVSGALASYFSQYLIGPDRLIPVCFEKSRWTPVIMLAILKTGSAFVLLDPSQPIQRLEEICRQANASVVVSSVEQASMVAQFAEHVATVGDDAQDWTDGEPRGLPTPSASHMAYALFTSGSTGKPKGVMVPHSTFLSSARAHAAAFGIDRHSRIMQFASYAFDACMIEMLTTLIMGGCICVASDVERKQSLPQAVARMQANYLVCTPSVARILSPRDLPTLKTILLGGEIVTDTEVNIWSDKIDLYQGYGPAECAVACTAAPRMVVGSTGRNVGKAIGCRTWVVDANDHEKPVPPGGVGELLIEGPIVSRGYLGEPEKTAAVFIQPPAWLRALGDTPYQVYKTGDLVKYKADGNLYYISRKDTQVKLRGQRFELGEVEHHVRQCHPGWSDAVVELVTFGEQSRRPMLVAFIYTEASVVTEEGDIFYEPSPEFRSAAQDAQTRLQEQLPGYMVPTVYIPLRRMPLSATGKADRRRLRSLVVDMSQIELLDYSHVAEAEVGPSSNEDGGGFIEPKTEAERQFRCLFANTFGVPVDNIGANSHFFRLGGDSLAAMALIQKAREAGYDINTADVFKQPKLSDLAAIATRSGPSSRSMTIAPFELIGEKMGKDDLLRLAASQCGVSVDQIEDIYPCAPLQEGLVALVAKRPGQYIANAEYRLASLVDIERFKSAWGAVAEANTILRTRVIQSDDAGSFQVVLRDPIGWHVYADEEAYEADAGAVTMGLGDELLHFALVPNTTGEEGSYAFHMKIHHALYDGTSLPLLWSQVDAAYRGSGLPSRPFNTFIDYLVRSRGSDEFWKSQFEGLAAPVFPALPSSRYVPDPSASLEYRVKDINLVSTEYTASTMMQLAWATVMSCYTDSDDVVYGLTLNGRSAPVADIAEVTGPTFTTFPFRTRVSQQDTIRDSLAAVQQKYVELMPHQHYGIQNIRQLGKEADAACNFQCQLGIQAPGGGFTATELLADVRSKNKDYGAFASYAFVLVCHLPAKGEGEMLVTVSHDANLIDPAQAGRMVRQFEHVLRQLQESQTSQSMRMGEVDLVSPDDRNQLASWNKLVPSSYDACLHDLVLRHAVERPDAPAISAWDGEMTYGQLGAASRILAQQLAARGIGPGALVPLVFDRSKWVVVAMTAVHMLGAACVNIDPTHPKDRIQHMIGRTQARHVLTSPNHESKMMDFDNLTAIVVPVTIEEEEARPRAEDFNAPPVNPQAAAFIVFTSGSTGKPKGIVMEHANLATSIRGYSEASCLTLDTTTRALHFASYAFDASIYEIFGALTNGACLCIPSESDRLNGIVPFIERHRVNFAIFTPSFLGLLTPESVPTVDTIMLGGEAITQENVRVWGSKVNLVTGYGPAEATICAVGPLPETGWKHGTLGHVTGGVGWVTMPSDRTRLAPIGVPGELVLEGPIVTRGYLGDPEKTAAAYMADPVWLRPFRPDGPESRVYFSGDLVMYNPDGTIRYLGRRDTQVKLRGQRIELGEVEHHVLRSFSSNNVHEVVAEVVSPRGGPPALYAFVALVQDGNSKSSGPDDSLFLTPTTEFLAQVEAATRLLRGAVPRYMVPSVILPLSEIPHNSSDKVDRRKLRDAVASLTPEDIKAFSGSNGPKRQPVTDNEKLMQSLWAQALKVDPHTIGADDDFFHLGGDSIIGMRLAGEVRRHGLQLQVATIFQHPTLSEMAEAAVPIDTGALADEYRPGSLLGIDDIHAFFDSELASQISQFKAEDVEDILPTTEAQTAFIHEDNVNYGRLHLGNKQVDPQHVEEACNALARRHAILRTVFVPLRGAVIQVVLRDVSIRLTTISCDEQENIQDFAEKLCLQYAASPVPHGTLHFQPYLITRSNSDNILVVRITHAQYDAVSFPLLSSDLQSALQGTLPTNSTAASFTDYLRYRLRGQAASGQVQEFWQEYLRNAEITNLPSSEALGRGTSPPPLKKEKKSRIMPFREIPAPALPDGITLGTVAKAAWAIVLARASGRRDVVFGQVINGRDAPLRNVDVISGPCITISPFRVSMTAAPQKEDSTSLDLLRHVQKQYMRSMPYVNMDFRTIVANATTWDPDTAELSSVVTVQDRNTSKVVSNTSAQAQWSFVDLSIPDALHVVVLPFSNADGVPHIHVKFVVSSHTLHHDTVNAALDEFCRALGELTADPTGKLVL
ncbi:hypothetical protein GGS20DRAFT_597269 [Poronia punctata]|nr:hypothetical protein GGS20DRAFT_597269 [Poronia punctata]